MNRSSEDSSQIPAVDEDGNPVALTVIRVFSVSEKPNSSFYHNQRSRLLCPTCNSKLHRIVPAAHLAIPNAQFTPHPLGTLFVCRKCKKQFKATS